MSNHERAVNPSILIVRTSDSQVDNDNSCNSRLNYQQNKPYYDVKLRLPAGDTPINQHKNEKLKNLLIYFHAAHPHIPSICASTDIYFGAKDWTAIMLTDIKVLHVSETTRGGPATYINNVVSLLSYHPGSTLVLVPEAHAADLLIDPAMIRVFSRKKRGLAGLLSMALAIWRLTRTFEPDIINAHGTFAAAVCRCLFFTTKYRTRIVYTVHCWPFIQDRSRAHRFIFQFVEFLLSHWCARIICVSRHQYLLGRAIGVAKGRMVRIYNGIAEEFTAPNNTEERDKLSLLFVGRFDHQKGLDILLDAVAELSDQVTLKVIGAGVIDSAVKLNVSKNVEFLGWMSPSQISAHFVHCDVVVMPSRWESFGLVAVEAMRAGRPVLASRIGSLSEVIKDGDTGFLFSPITKEGLIDGIKRCYTAELRSMGKSGNDRFHSMFTSRQSASRLAEVYVNVHAENCSRNILNKRRPTYTSPKVDHCRGVVRATPISAVIESTAKTGTPRSAEL